MGTDPPTLEGVEGPWRISASQWLHQQKGRVPRSRGFQDSSFINAFAKKFVLGTAGWAQPQTQQVLLCTWFPGVSATCPQIPTNN